ncbi:MAG TPA: M14 family zinc carboxypeptidase [Draconibacterium sp.]|nr:M14 family zinc carboxypeptidase [Draconibacterium sp.]
MKSFPNKKPISFLFLFLFLAQFVFAQIKIEAGDPPNNKDIPIFFKSKLSDIQNEIKNVKTGEVKIIATSPGELPVYAVFYGKKEDFKSQANYNSAVAAQNPAYFAQKDSSTKPVVFFVGPVHGQEVEGIVGLVNLIHIAETGKDYRGKDWTSLQNKLKQCRTIIIPCGNPDGRKRCPYDSFLGLPTKIMTKYGQGTHKDGTSWGWPQAKSVHPMKGDVGILGAYFNDEGINVMQDEYFNPMAKETEAILEMARTEAPDITVSLHSHENRPVILQPAFVPMFMKERVHDLAINLNQRFKKAGLAYWPDDWFWTPKPDDKEFPPKTTFNLVGALYHICGTTSFTFECSQGCVSENAPKPFVTYDNILDIQLTLYDEIFNTALNKRLTWKK